MSFPSYKSFVFEVDERALQKKTVEESDKRNRNDEESQVTENTTAPRSTLRGKLRLIGTSEASGRENITVE